MGKVLLLNLKPGDKFIGMAGVVCTVEQVGELYPCVEGFDYHCAKGEKFDVTLTRKLPAWDEPQQYTHSYWKETEVFRA